MDCPTPIAILMAAYNAEKYISQQLDSVINQTNQDWTLYIRNDGSIDGTQLIIDTYIEKYPNKIIQIDKAGENLGCNGNFYRLLEVVNAKYYMFCDADDVWLEDKTDILYTKITEVEKNYPNESILVHGDMIVCNEDLTIIYPSLWNYLNLKPERITGFFQILVRPVIGGSTSIFNSYAKMCVFPTPCDNRILYDHWVGLCVAKNGRIISINKVLKFYRQHDGQVCGLDSVRIKKPFVTRVKEKLKHTQRDADLFKSIGIPKWKFYICKIRAYILKFNL